MSIIRAVLGFFERAKEFFLSVFMVLAVVVIFSLGYLYFAASPWAIRKRVRQGRLMKVARTLGFKASRFQAEHEEGHFSSVKIEVDKLLLAQAAHASDGYWLGGIAYQAISTSDRNKPNSPESISTLFEFFDSMKRSCLKVGVVPDYAARALVLRENTIDYSGNEATYHYSFEECVLLLAKSGLSCMELADLMKASIGFEDILNRDLDIPVALLKEIYAH